MIATGRNCQNSDVVMDAAGKGFQRNIAERMVEKMADQIGKQHQPADETDLPEADAANEFPSARVDVVMRIQLQYRTRLDESSV